jgi:hypothetical protein
MLESIISLATKTMGGKMFKHFFKLFQSELTVIADTTKHKENAIKHLISRHSNGNVNLQQAKYITENILKEKQENLFSYKFA